MKVTTDELRRAAMALLDHLDGVGQSSFEIEEDHYWAVPPESRYDPEHEPSSLTIGQLTDDWKEISTILTQKREPV